jgi:hypothetical protein
LDAENPYIVAKEFVERHQLSTTIGGEHELVDRIAQLIVNNTIESPEGVAAQRARNAETPLQNPYEGKRP